MRAIHIVWLGAALMMSTPGIGYAAAKHDAGFDKTVAVLRASFERDKQLPLDPAIYAASFHVGHNYEPGKIVEAPVFLKGVGEELAAAKRTGANSKMELTRFLVADDTVVATVMMTGQLADGTPTRFNIAYFFKIADGKVIDLETWYDRKTTEAQMQAVQKEMKKQ